MERESAEVMAEAKARAEQQANEIIAAAKQSAKQIIFQAFQRSLSNLLEKDQSDQEAVEGEEDGERQPVTED